MEKKRNSFKNILNSRSMKYGSNSIILIVAVIAIAILVNIFIGMADIRLDLTPNKLFSLSDITKTTLNELQKDVTIVGLFDEGKVGTGNEYTDVKDLLSQYEKYSHVKVRYVDPDKNPDIIKELDSQNTMDLQTNNFVVICTTDGKEKKKKLVYDELFQINYDEQSMQTYSSGSNAEQGFTGAIRFVVSDKTPVVYFTQGHNEINVDSEYTNVKKFLESNNYYVKTLNIFTTDKIPEDAEMLIIASPKSDLTVAERDVIAQYLVNGGKAAFMFDYLPNDPDFTQYNNLLSAYNVAVNYDKIKENDQSRSKPEDPYTFFSEVIGGAIIPQDSYVVLSNARSISILKNTKESIKTTSLLKTSDQAVGMTANKARGGDNPGPLDIAVAVENTGNAVSSKILLMGNASFVSDSAYVVFGSNYERNALFVLQSLSWMFDKKDEIMAPSKEYELLTFNITAMQANVMGMVVIVVVPLIILGAGLYVFLRRRHL